MNAFRTARRLFCYLFIFNCASVYAQRQPDQVYMPQIATVQLYRVGDPLSYPIVSLGGMGGLELHFDDLDGDVKNYYYTLQLCNADWSPVPMSYMDYVRGFTYIRITNYRYSAIALTRYTHYQASLFDRNLVPSKSGNYLLKVFLNGDTSQLAFTRRLLVLDRKMSAAAQIQQPYNPAHIRSGQKIQLSVSSNNTPVSYPQQQVKVVILQNYRWDNARTGLIPSIIRNNLYEYNSEQDAIFPAGKEWRWLDLRSFRLLSDRVTKQENTEASNELFVKTDAPRPNERYVYFTDQNGGFRISNRENLNPYWNGDYATVHFSFVPPGNVKLPTRDVYLFGALTQWGTNDSARMRWNDEARRYETSLFLKQGYYDYTYVTRENRPGNLPFAYDLTEGNHWETENTYTVLIYYRELGGRYDQLLGMTELSSRFNRPDNWIR